MTRRRYSQIFGKVLLVFTSVVVSLLALEIVVRIMSPTVAFFDFRNFVVDPVRLVRQSNPGVVYDPDLGWIDKPSFQPGGTGSIGERLNRTLKPDEPVPPIPADPILVVGSSFTWGSDVTAEMAWPAQLEQILKVPVVNMAVGGYGITQITIMAERMTPIVKPRLVLFDMESSVISFDQYSVFSGAPKPYYTPVDGHAVLRNSPVPPYHPGKAYIGTFRAIFGYSYLIAWAAERLGVLNKWQTSTYDYVTAQSLTQAVDAACMLADRLKALHDKYQVPVIVVGNYVSQEILDGAPTSVTKKFISCAENDKLPVIDFWDVYQGIKAAGGNAAIEALYQPHRGHFSNEGNRLSAETVAKYLRENDAGLM
jgi:lysophospholipase L1-like esterase